MISDGDKLDEALHVVFGYAIDVQGVPVSVEDEYNVSCIAFGTTPDTVGRVTVRAQSYAENVGATHTVQAFNLARTNSVIDNHGTPCR